MKAKSHISNIIVVLFIIASIGPGIQLAKYVSNKRSSVVTQKTKSVGYMTTAKSLSLSNPHRSLPDYQIIVKNNLFKPLDEQKIVAVVATSSPQQIIQTEKPRVIPVPLNKLTFTGVVQLESEYSALVEDSSKNEAYFLRKGDKLKDYIVETISEESISMSNGNSEFTIPIGSVAYYNSNGQISTSETRNNQTTAAKLTESKAEETASLNKSSANLSLIEQMKARRKKELEQ